MRTRKPLLTLLLSALTLTAATAQTVTYTIDDAITEDKPISELGANSLATATAITAKGEWTTADIASLRDAMKPSSGNNNSLQTADLSAMTFSGESISMEGLFKNCRTFTGVTMPTQECTATVSFNSAFWACTALEGTMDLSAFTNVSSFDTAFYGCVKLTGITLPAENKYTGSVTFLNAFRGCSLRTINLSAFTNTSSFSLAFYDCKALTGVTMPAKNEYTGSVTFESAFERCSSLEGTIDLSAFTNVSSFRMTFYNCGKLTGVTMPTQECTATVTFESAFEKCSSLGTINLSAFTNVSSFNNAFNGCSALTGVTLPAGSKCTDVDFSGAFLDCSSLEGTIDLSAFTNVDSFISVFNGCSKLTGVIMPAQSKYTNGVYFSGAFGGCTSLEGTIDLSAFTNVGSFSSVFNGCSKLTGVIMPAENKYMYKIDFSNAFQDCSSLEGTIDLSVFSNMSSFNNAFQGCTKLVAVKLGTIPSGYTTDAFLDANPNLLKYLSNRYNVPADWTNCILEGKSLAGITLTDEKPFHCPEAFDMGEGSAMSYTRTLTKDKWATVCLPFAAQVPADCVAKQLSGSTDASVSFGKVETLEANKPYIVAYTGNEPTQAVTFASATAAQIPATPAALETAATDYKMAGTYADLVEQSMYLLNDNNSFLLYNAGNLRPFRACITAANGQPNLAPRLSISHDDGGVTGLDFTTLPAGEAEVIPAVSRVYTLDGRLVKTVPAEEYATLKQGLERGIYVVNGKKMTVTE